MDDTILEAMCMCATRYSTPHQMPEMSMMNTRLYLHQVTKGLGNVGRSYATVRKLQ